MEGMLVKYCAMQIGDTYINGGTIEETLKAIEEYVPLIEDTDNYEDILGKARARISIVNELMGLKRLKNNKADLLTLMRDINQNLEIISKLAIHKEAE